MQTKKLLISLAAVCLSGRGALGRPQEVDLDLVGDIFGKSTAGGSYGPVQDAPAAVVQVVKNTHPADYVESPNNYENNKASVEVNKDFSSCSDYTQSLGYECVPYYQCANGTIITDGAGLIDVRGGFADLNPEGSKCQGLLDVCCKNPDFVPPPPPKIKYQPRCGRHNTEGVGARIQGFKEGESQFGEWPHMCAVLEESIDEYSGNVNNKFLCGGSLIAPGIVLTAAHCVQNHLGKPRSVKVRCGEWDTQRKIEPYNHQDRLVAEINIHPEFNPKNLANDFGLLFTESDFERDYHVDTVCLPGPFDVFDGAYCTATGWGKNKFGAEGEYQVVLKEIDLPVVNYDQCQAKMKTTRLGEYFKLDRSFMCAGGIVGKDTCTGDGGSPLVCPARNDPNTYFQAGIVAWGIGCGGDVPGVYADVSKAVCWIDYVASCRNGNGDSFFGRTESECSGWFRSNKERSNDGYSGSLAPPPALDYMKNTLNRCTVNWERDNSNQDDTIAGAGYGRAAPAEADSDPELSVRIDAETLDTIHEVLVEEEKKKEEKTDNSAVNFG